MLKSMIRALSSFLGLAFFTTMASGQGCNYHNNYATYAATAVNPTNGYVTETVTLTGSMTPPNCTMNGATHTPKLEAVVNTSYGGWNTGPSVSPSSYINYSHSWTFDWDTDCSNDACSLWLLGDVVCTIAGTFFGNGPGGVANYIAERAITLAQNTGVPYTLNSKDGWYVTPLCTPATSPPDFPVGDYYNADGSATPLYQYIKGQTLCTRSATAKKGTPWNCPSTLAYVSLNSAQETIEVFSHGNGTAYNCTHYDSGYSGLPFP